MEKAIQELDLGPIDYVSIVEKRSALNKTNSRIQIGMDHLSLFDPGSPTGKYLDGHDRL